MNGTLPIEPPTGLEETTNQWKGERWHEETENDNNNIIVIVDDDTDENLINNDDDKLIKIIKAKDQILQQSNADERMNGSSSFYKNLSHISDNDFIGRLDDDLPDGNYVNGHYDEEDQDEEGDVEEEYEEEIVDENHVGHALDDEEEEEEDDDDLNRDDEEYICEYYSDGDGGDDKQEILKRIHGDGIIAKLLVGWYISIYSINVDIN